MFKRFDLSFFSLAACAQVLAIYTANFSSLARYIFLGLSLLCFLGGLIPLMLSPKVTFQAIVQPRQAMAFLMCPITLILFIYERSTQSFLTRPFEPALYVAVGLFLLGLFVELVLVLSTWSNAEVLLGSYAMCSLLIVPIYVSSEMHMDGLSNILMVLLLLANIVLLIPAFYTVFTKVKNPSFRSYFSFFFVEVLFVFILFFDVQTLAVLSVLWIALTMTAMMISMLFIFFDRENYRNDYQASLTFPFVLALWAVQIFKSQVITLSDLGFNLSSYAMVNAYIPYFLQAVEYLLLFFSFTLFMNYFLRFLGLIYVRDQVV